jgi:hypothetical protein
MHISALTGLLTPLKDWFTAIGAEKNRRNERYQEAISTLYVALNGTRIYIGSLERRRRANACLIGDRRDEIIEANLSRLRTAASSKLRPFNHELAERCLLKGDYWTNPDNWNETEIKLARIGITQMFREARKLLSA